MKNIVTFGEIMLRLSPPGMLRFSQARSFDLAFGGGESNVAVSLSNFGLPTQFVSRIPANDLGDACIKFLHQFDVRTKFVLRGGERIGIYLMEFGANMRGSQVIYDRAYSSFSTLNPGMIDWDLVFTEAGWFHWTGITPAVSEGAAAVCLEGIKAAKSKGIIISCDLNFRAKLWKWGKTANEVMRELVSYSDVIIGNEEDAEKVFGIIAPESDITAGKVDSDQYKFVCTQLAEQFPSAKQIAITLRGSISANHNTWSGIYRDRGKFFEGNKYDLTHIVDRVGSGDSFMAGLIYGLINFPEDSQRVIDFAVAASALKHTIVGDFNLVSLVEVEKLLDGNSSGRVSR